MKDTLIYIIGTHSTGTKGGISSVLVAFEEAFKKFKQPYQRIDTHNDSKGTFLYFIIAWIKLLISSVKHFKSRRVYWLHCGPWFSMFRKFLVALTGRLLGGEVVIHFHSPTLYQYSNSKIGMFLLKIFLAPANKVIVITPWWKDLLIKKGFKVDILILSNPLSYDFFEHAKKEEAKKTQPKANINLVSMARLIEGKGVELVIKSMPDIPNARLKIIGDGPLKGKLTYLAESLAVDDRIDFLGWLNGEEKGQALSEADIFCLPSIYDSFGVVFIEAMSLGLPIVAYNNGPVADIVKPNLGIAIAEYDTKHLVSAINKVASNLSNYQSNGKKEVLTEYNPTELSKQAIKYLLK